MNRGPRPLGMRRAAYSTGWAIEDLVGLYRKVLRVERTCQGEAFVLQQLRTRNS